MNTATTKSGFSGASRREKPGCSTETRSMPVRGSISRCTDGPQPAASSSASIMPVIGPKRMHRLLQGISDRI